MTQDEDQEAERVRQAYARRATLGLDGRYAYWQPANLFIYQSRERALLRALRDARRLPLAGSTVLDAGCGDGSVLRELLKYGAAEENLYGIDLLPARVEQARVQLPRARLDTGDVRSLPYDVGTFDLVLAFTLLSSIVDPEARRQAASEMLRVARPGGLILIYDFRVNPFNRDVKSLRPDDVRILFPEKEIRFYGTTLAPPVTKLLTRLPGGWVASSFLEVIPFLRTHYIAAIPT